jgi:hypothetical protein
MAETLKLRAELLIIARRLAEDEPITREDADLALSTFVTRLCADPVMSPTALALIAVSLAKHIEQTDG